MCSCNNVKVGSYANQVEINRPSHMVGRTEGSKSSMICIDRCILEEIKYLWSLGISTTGCCCGHNVLEPYVGVIESDIPKMKKLGYEVLFNECRPNDEDSFKLKFTE